jgi:uncharacterized protein YaaR (DUF327 family)
MKNQERKKEKEQGKGKKKKRTFHWCFYAVSRRAFKTRLKSVASPVQEHGAFERKHQ